MCIRDRFLRAKIDRELIRQFSASAAWMASSTAWRLRTGSAPGNPRQTGQTLVFGGAPKPVGHPQKILVRVASCTCTSRPITGSYRAITSGATADVMLDAMASIIPAGSAIDSSDYRKAPDKSGVQALALVLGSTQTFCSLGPTVF